jgi:hypothetical protein
MIPQSLLEPSHTPQSRRCFRVGQPVPDLEPSRDDEETTFGTGTLRNGDLLWILCVWRLVKKIASAE